MEYLLFKFPIFDYAVGIDFKFYSNLSDGKSMLLPSAKRAKLKSNEVCNVVQPNEDSSPAFKNVLRCCANIIATGTDLN